MNEKRRPQGRNFPPRPVQAAPAEEAEGQLEGRRVLIDPDHRAVVLTDHPEFSSLRGDGLILEYLPDRRTWQRHRPDRRWDEVLAGRLSRLYAEHGAAQVLFIDPDSPPTLPDLLA